MKTLYILIHGWQNNPKSMHKIATIIEAAGHDTLSLSYSTTGIKNFSDLLPSLIEDIKEKEKNQYDKINFIGHSMGGIVARFLIQEFKTKSDLFITLGTPHNGSKIISIMNKNKFLKTQLDDIASLLEPNSDFILSVPKVPENISTYCIFGNKRFSLFYSPAYLTLFNYEKEIVHDGMIEAHQNLMEKAEIFLVREKHSKLPLNKESIKIIKNLI